MFKGLEDDKGMIRYKGNYNSYNCVRDWLLHVKCLLQGSGRFHFLCLLSMYVFILGN